MVALDYGNKLQDGLLMAHAVILKNMYRLSKISSHLPVTEANIILENYRPSAISLPVKSVLRFTDTDTERRVFIFNPLLRTRDTMIHLFADTPNLLILDTDGKRISYQVTPALDDMHAVGHFLDVLRISFFIRLAPLALKAITVQSLGPRSKRVRVAERLSCVIRWVRLGDRLSLQSLQCSPMVSIFTLELRRRQTTGLFPAVPKVFAYLLIRWHLRCEPATSASTSSPA